MSQNFNAAPYNDDYNKLKGYLRILFRPSFAVQARELTQSQTILQNQISRLGDYFFEEGSEVLNGQTQIDLSYDYIKIQNTGNHVVLGSPVPATQIAKFIGVFDVRATGLTSGVTAQIINVIDATGTDPVTYYIKYNNSGTNGTTKTFLDNEFIKIQIIDSNDVVTYEFDSHAATTNATGKGSSVSVSAGTRYIQGFFVNIEQQTLILDKYTNTPTANIGIRIVEDIVTSSEDPSLLDNAQTSPNYAADGAHRYRIRLILDTNATDSENFIRLVTLKNGKIEADYRQSKLATSGIEKELAKRMYDHAGNFIVDPFKVEIREHLEVIDIDTGISNRGKFSLVEGGDETKCVLDMDSGRAYVSGFEIKTTGAEYVEIKKARATANYNNAIIGASYGAYVEVNNLVGVPDFNAQNQVNLRLTTTGTAGTIGSGTLVGTARIRNIELKTPAFSAGLLTTASVFKIYLFDIQLTGTYKFDNVLRIDGNGVDGSTFSCLPVTTMGVAILNDRNNSMCIEQLPYTVISQFKDVSYSVRRTITLTNPTAVITFSAPSGATFEPTVYGNYSLVRKSNGSYYDIYSSVVLLNNLKTLQITLSGSPPAGDYFLDYTINKNDATSERKSKDRNTNVDTFTSGLSAKLQLTKADCISITSIKDQLGNDITANFDFDNGQRDGYYGLGSIIKKPSYTVTATTLTVTYDYYLHSSGDYCTSESYPSIDFKTIPEYVSSFGETINLRDSIDFRPIITVASPTDSKDLFIPNSAIRGDVTYYLSRKDKVSVDELGNYIVIEGTPALKPVSPHTPSTGMMLFEIDIPAYTFSVDDVKLDYVEHKRFTMKDIGRLETRIEKLEYYTALSFLESAVNQKEFDDGSGARFKNGFIVDPFIGTNVGNVKHADYKCSIDTKKQECRPEASSDSIDLEYIEAESSNVQQTGQLLTLPYTEVELANQYLASKTVNLNPYAVFSWEGSVDLTPHQDSWIDGDNNPAVIVNRDGVNDGFIYTGKGRRARRNAWRRFWSWWTHNWAGNPNVSLKFVKQGKRALRFEITQKTNTVTQNVNDRAIDISAIPYMRSRDVQFSAKRLKPLSVVYPFFDGVLVTANVMPTGGIFGGQLKTNDKGEVSGTFRIPNNDKLKFRTGSREFRLIDDITNDENISTTLATASYEAKGTLDSRQGTIVSTRPAKQVLKRIGHWRELTRGSLAAGATSSRFNWADPLAESFLIKEEGGCFLTSIDVFFKTKDKSLPVTLQIRDMANGYPAQKQFPFGEVVLQSSDVNISEDGSVSTTFTFESPVYLQEDTEYCFVLLTNSQQYNIFASRMGEQDILTKEYIAKQPYAGVMFKSQNASTWTAEQTEDIKFKIRKAQFNTSAVSSVILKNKDVSTVLMEPYSFYTTSGSQTIKVRQDDHGMHIDSIVRFSGKIDAVTDLEQTILPVSGIVLTATDWKAINVINCDTYEMVPVIDTAVGNASTTQWDGADNIMATHDVMMDTLFANIEVMKVSGTDLKWKANLCTGRSVNGDASTQKQYVMSGLLDIDTTDNVDFVLPYKIASKVNEDGQTNLNGSRSFIMQGELSSDNANVSPVLDLNRMSIVAASNRITYPTDISDELLYTVQDEEKAAQSKYIVNTVTLNDPAIGVKVLFDGHRPIGSDFKCYIKVLGSDTDRPFDTEVWHLMTAQVYPANNAEEDDFSEYTFTVEGSSFSVPEFSVFSIKIVMLGENSALPPIIRDFRAVALGT